MENNPLRGLFGVSSPRPVEQRVAPQPTEPTENENENELSEKRRNLNVFMPSRVLLLGFALVAGRVKIQLERN